MTKTFVYVWILKLIIYILIPWLICSLSSMRSFPFERTLHWFPKPLQFDAKLANFEVDITKDDVFFNDIGKGTQTLCKNHIP